MSRVTTRKRTAPGAEPMHLQQLQHSPQMSSDQFAQWSPQVISQQIPGYTAQSNNYGQQTYSNAMDQTVIGATSQNQLSRRPASNQLATRPGESNGAWPDTSLTPTQQSYNAELDGGDDLDRRAEAAKREMQANRKQIPPFVQKLSSFLDESRKTDLIRWSDDGDSFIVFDEDEFANTLIPELFKHKKFTSFVRQLNMYGFHKKVGLSDNSMRASEKKNKSPSEYTHPYFKRNRPNLLWLIQKPKTTSNKTGKNTKASRQDESEDENEDVFDVDSPTAANFVRTENANALRANRQQLMLGAPGGAGQVSEELLLNVQDQLRQVQATQRSIAMMMKKIMSDHDNITQKASMFQGLHEKHESSINAILNFLASVYSKSLDGNQTANIANMFANAIPQNSQPQSAVVDMGDYSGQRQNLFDQPSQSTRKQPLLLQAPDFDTQQAGHVSNASPSESNLSRRGSRHTASTPQQQEQQQSNLQNPQQNPNKQPSSNAHSPSIQEIFDRTPSIRSSSSPQPSATADTDKNLPETDIMSIINAHNNQNNSNANDLTGGINMDFPEALSHLQGGDTSNQLTPTQQNSVLQLMSRNSPSRSNNMGDTLANRPSPGAIESMEQYNQTRDDLGSLSNAIKEQNQKVESLSQILAPLSPSGSIPGLSLSDPNDPLNLDFDRFIFDNENLDHGNYFSDGLDLNGQPNLDLDGNAHMNNEIDFSIPDDLGASTMQGNDGLGNDLAEEGRVVGSVDTSEVTSPANTTGFDEGGGDDGDGQASPRKRRRRE